MDRIATCSIIKGNGGVEAYVNGVVSEELRMRRTVRKRPLRQRVRDRIADGWAWVMGCIVTYPKLIKSWKD